MPSNESLDLVGVIGFNGKVKNGLILHPGDQHIIYALGSTIVVKDLLSNEQTFLHNNGHDSEITCLALSDTGKYLASGQKAYMGYKATIIIWDLETYEIMHKCILHRDQIQDLAFSTNEEYLASLGSIDDGNRLVVWDILSGKAICGTPAHSEKVECITFLNNDNHTLISAGHYNIRCWTLDVDNRKLRYNDCNLGSLKRVVTSITVDDDDNFFVCGTTTGDAIKISLTQKILRERGPNTKKLFGKGITCVTKTYRGNYIIGAGDGTISVLLKDTFKVLRRQKVEGSITSLTLNAAGDHFFVGTNQS